ncbi:hypothetical protein BDZ94DRAFT_1276387 [Collybia nuda]|uniref:Copper acquisition factor BIM1-like domain-containing protein n=1 Tax=Collybia nuda TaxID=64659 RepID=A0A9P5XVB6_9AGAR|nr:hypothetical protein BDZ94DRAFT_1276387 [Collybia nuda]
MRHTIALVFFGLVGIVSAHFQLQFPPPRGVFNEDSEPTFCDGYANPAANRTEFPLSGGFFTLNSEHPSWTGGVLVSPAANPTSFDNFTQVVPFFQVNGEGVFCIPLNFTANANGTSLKGGENVTIQIVFDGGDSTLYQCADLTLSNNVTISSDVVCSNATGTPSGPSSGSKNLVTPMGLISWACGIIAALLVL